MAHGVLNIVLAFYYILLTVNPVNVLALFGTVNVKKRLRERKINLRRVEIGKKYMQNVFIQKRLPRNKAASHQDSVFLLNFTRFAY